MEDSVRTTRFWAEDRVLSALVHEAEIKSTEPEIAVPRGWFYCHSHLHISDQNSFTSKYTVISVTRYY